MWRVTHDGEWRIGAEWAQMQLAAVRARMADRPRCVCVGPWYVHVWSINHVPVIILRTTNVICLHNWRIRVRTSKPQRPRSHTCTMIDHDRS